MRKRNFDNVSVNHNKIAWEKKEEYKRDSPAHITKVSSTT